MAEKLYYSMGEVSEMFDVKPSLLRHWESQFPVLRPKRNKKGNRLFTPQDVENLKLIYHLVKERGMTLDGARKALRSRRTDKGVSRDAELMERLQHIRALLVEVREDLKKDEGEVVAIEDSDDFVAEENLAAERAADVVSGFPSETVAADAAAAVGEDEAAAPEPSPAEQVEENAAPEPVAEASGDDSTEEVAVSEPQTAEPAAAAPKPALRRKAVVKLDEENTDAETVAGTDGRDGGAPVPRPTRRPRRGKKEDAENKELFAFYEQSLF